MFGRVEFGLGEKPCMAKYNVLLARDIGRLAGPGWARPAGGLVVTSGGEVLSSLGRPRLCSSGWPAGRRPCNLNNYKENKLNYKIEFQD